MYWPVPLASRPAAALFAIGIHGPNRIDRFRLDRHWALHLYNYSAKVFIDGQEFMIRPGTATLIPPGVITVYHFTDRSIHACAHFTFPGEYLVTDAGTGAPDLGPSAGVRAPDLWPSAGVRAPDHVMVPAIQDLGHRFGVLYQGLEEGISAFGINRLRAEVRLWDLLWQLVDRVPNDRLRTDKAHPAVLAAAEVIDLRLADELSVARVVEASGISHTHLTRLFREAYGRTIVGYIRDRRVERARHMLLHTHLSIKSIAEQVGVSDPRFFNKIIHQGLGDSPQGLRTKARLGEIGLSQPPRFDED